MSMPKQNPLFPIIFSELRKSETFDIFAFFQIPRSKYSNAKFQRFPLIELMGTLEAAEATDPRDTRFALLSLANDLDEEEILFLHPDYEEDVKSVVCRYASALVRKGYFRKILYNAHLEPSPHNLPSWVPNWIAPVTPITKKVSLGAHGKYIYKAARNTTQQARMGDTPDVFVVSGGSVDTIDYVSLGTVMPRTAGIFLHAVVNIILKDIDRIFDGLSTYPTGEPLSEVKWKTLIANSTMFTHQEAPSSDRNIYRV
jgi:hypothetical protein